MAWVLFLIYFNSDCKRITDILSYLALTSIISSGVVSILTILNIFIMVKHVGNNYVEMSQGVELSPSNISRSTCLYILRFSMHLDEY